MYRPVKCQLCARLIIWATTEKNNAMPVDPRPVPTGNIELRQRDGYRTPLAVVVPREQRDGRSDLRMPHAATCTQDRP